MTSAMLIWAIGLAAISFSLGFIIGALLSVNK